MPSIESVKDFLEDQVTTVPDNIRYPLIAAAGALPLGYLAFNVWRFNRNQECDAYIPSNPDLVNATLTEIHPTTRSRWQRWGSAALGAVGLSMAALQATLPTYDVRVSNPNSGTAVITDNSFSMLRTEDIIGPDGSVISRRAGISLALSGFSADHETGGGIGFVNFGETAEQLGPLSEEWEGVASGYQAASEAGENSVSPNGSNLAAAIDLAVDMFPAAESSSSPDDKDGETDDMQASIVIVTDAVILKPTQAEQIQQGLVENGIKAEVILIGTPRGSFKMTEASPPIDSGVRPDFAKIIDSEPTVVTSEEDLQTALRDMTKDMSTSIVKKPWYVPGFLAGMFMAWSYGRSSRQHRRRVNF